MYVTESILTEIVEFISQGILKKCRHIILITQKLVMRDEGSEPLGVRIHKPTSAFTNDPYTFNQRGWSINYTCIHYSHAKENI